MTFADLRALHAIIGAAIDDIERVYHPSPRSRRPSHSSTIHSTNTSSSRSNYSCTSESDAEAEEADVSAPPTPTTPAQNVRFASTRRRRGRERAQTLPPMSNCPPGSLPPPILKQPPLDFPSLDTPITPASMSDAEAQAERTSTDAEGIGETPRQKEWRKKCEDLTSHPDVIAAVNKIVAACGQMTATIQKPFLTLCDAAMGYHLPACLRFLEASHIVEILREAGSRGMHVEEIAARISSAPQYGQGQKGVDSNKLSHILRLLATHHITREVRPNVFVNNRISSVIDSGKSWKDITSFDEPEKKYEETDGFAAFVGLCTDEIFKAAAYLTDCYLLPEHRSRPPPESFLPSPPQSASASSPFHSPGLPPRVSVAASASTTHGICSPADSTVSLPEEGTAAFGSPVRNREPITFAPNPSPIAHKRNRSTDVGPATPSTATRRPRGLSMRRLSTRSTTPTPDTPRSPPLPRPDPTTPRSAASSGSPSESDALGHVLRTPRSPRVRDSESFMSLSSSSSAASVEVVKKKASFSSFRALRRKASMGMNALGLLGTGTATPNTHSSEQGASPPTPRSPFVTRSRQASAQGYMDGHTRFAYAYVQSQEPKRACTPGQGQLTQRGTSSAQDTLLGPAFDLRPPSLTTSPQSHTSSGSHSTDVAFPFAAMSLPRVPPMPPMSHIARTAQTQQHPPPLAQRSMMRQTSSPDVVRNAQSVSPLNTRVQRAGAPPPLALVKLTASGSERTISQRSQAERTEGKAAEQGVRRGNEMYAPFNIAFKTGMRYFEWLEQKENVFQLKRFGKAMTGTSGWEGPGSVIGGFPWHELLPKSVVVDVGGGIGSTSMLLANAFPHLRFVIQDRPPVVEMGTAAWRSRYPELLDSGRAAFQAHDFFKPQPAPPAELDIQRTELANDAHGTKEEEKKVIPSVFFLRVITHDWPDSYVTRVLLRLRQAAGPNTRLLLADYILPLACVDEDEDGEIETHHRSTDFGKKLTREPLPGTVRTLAPEGSPLLPNLGKSNANAYWLDLTMRVMFNSQERTLRELAALTLTAGWKITQVTRSEGSLFGHIIAVPVDIPLDAPTLDDHEADLDSKMNGDSSEIELASLPMSETFLSSMLLPSEDAVKAGMERIRSGTRAQAVHESGCDEPKKRTRRERASTFSASRSGNAKDGRDGKFGAEARKGWKTLVKMLSKPHLRGGHGPEQGNGEGGGNGGSGTSKGSDANDSHVGLTG